MGHAAVLALHSGRSREMVGVQGNQIAYVPLEQAIKHHASISPYLLELVDALS